MKETWRWFGPDDPIPLDHIKQAGATGIVSALHHFYRGEAWPLDEVLKRRDEILAAGLVWSVVESIPIHNSIKLRSGRYAHFISAWKDTLATVAKAGVPVICYNFMPVVDGPGQTCDGACQVLATPYVLMRWISPRTTCSSSSAKAPRLTIPKTELGLPAFV